MSSFVGNKVAGLSAQGGAIAAYGSDLSLLFCTVVANAAALGAEPNRNESTASAAESAVIQTFSGDGEAQV